MKGNTKDNMIFCSRTRPENRFVVKIKTIAAASASAVFALSLGIQSACCLPGIDPKYIDNAEEEAQKNSALATCSNAYWAALTNMEKIEKAPGSYTKAYAAANASAAWTRTASLCPSHFSEGTIKAAQTRITAENAAKKANIGLPKSAALYDAKSSDIKTETEKWLKTAKNKNIDRRLVSADTVNKFALAEDRLAFGLEVYAARNASDRTKTLAESCDKARADSTAFYELAKELNADSGNKNFKDSREMLYSVENFADKNEITDTYTGLAAGTDSVFEIDCALELLNAFENDLKKNGTEEENKGSNEENAIEAAKQARHKALHSISGFIQNHIMQAEKTGFPVSSSRLLNKTE